MSKISSAMSRVGKYDTLIQVEQGWMKMVAANPNVLVVEDDPELNELVGAYVQIVGYEYRGAPDGEAALRLARQRRPALIVLDVMLPDIDGFEVCRRLKSDDRTRSIPVVMLTALDREEHRQRGKDCGAVAYLTKPFDPDALMRTIRETSANGENGT